MTDLAVRRESASKRSCCKLALLLPRSLSCFQLVMLLPVLACAKALIASDVALPAFFCPIYPPGRRRTPVKEAILMILAA